MDLTNVHDHPAVYLKSLSDRYKVSSDPLRAHALATASVALHGYERDNKVTFAALDNDVLAEIRRIQGVLHSTVRPDPAEYHDLLDEINNLIGAVEG